MGRDGRRWCRLGGLPCTVAARLSEVMVSSKGPTEGSGTDASMLSGAMDTQDNTDSMEGFRVCVLLPDNGSHPALPSCLLPEMTQRMDWANGTTRRVETDGYLLFAIRADRYSENAFRLASEL